MAGSMQALEAAAYVSFILGALFAVYQLRMIARDRQTEFIMRVGEFVCSRDFEGALCKIWEAKSEDVAGLLREVSYTELSMVADYFEGVCDLAEKRLIDEKLVIESYALDTLWRKMKPWIDEVRKGEPKLYETFEKMAPKRL